MIILKTSKIMKRVKKKLLKTKKFKNSLGGKDIVQLKSNHIPRGLIPLEKLFDQNDVAKDPKMKPADDVVEDKI